MTTPTLARSAPMSGINLTKRQIYAVLATLLILFSLAPAMPGKQSVGYKLHSSLLNMTGAVSVIVQATDLTAAESYATSLGGKVTDDLHIIKAFAVTLPAEQLLKLAESNAIRMITPNTVLIPTDEAVDFTALGTIYPGEVNAPQAWGFGHGDEGDNHNGVTGRGVTVATLDTGITSSADFNDASGHSRVIVATVVNTNTTTAIDRFGHGTHVAGIIAGNSLNNPTVAKNDAHVGIAPEANLISVKIADDSGSAHIIDAIKGMQWIVDHQAQYHIRIVNISFQTNYADNYIDDPIDATIEQAWFHGIVVVVAAGNHGNLAHAVDVVPANDPFVITVGAVEDNHTATRSDDGVATWSTRGKTIAGYNKPEIVAPGTHIASVAVPGSILYKAHPEGILSDGYFRMGGTSMSAPVVAGAVALYLQRYPQATPDQVKYALMHTTRSVGNAETKGDELDAAKLVNRAPDGSANGGVAINKWVDPNGTIDYTGYQFTGYQFTGYTFNGYQFTGYTFNGYSFNSYVFNGYVFNGYVFNSYTFNVNNWD